MSWADPLGDLRTTLADGPTDNLVKSKKIIGPVNGQNRTFFTFEDRLIASGNQSVCTIPLRIFTTLTNSSNTIVAELSGSGITVSDQVRGEFTLQTAPSGQIGLVGSYHYQQSLDAELNFFLQQGANRVGIPILANIPEGLQAAVLDYAGAMVHTRLATRWQQRKSEQFMLQDQPAREEAEALITFHRDEAVRMLAEAQQARRDFYDLRQDMGRAAAFAILNRVPGPYTPRR